MLNGIYFITFSIAYKYLCGLVWNIVGVDKIIGYNKTMVQDWVE